MNQMNELPFVFGRLAEGGEFANRSLEKERLKTNFAGGINTVLISPRRWGKSSLIQRVAAEMEESGGPFRFVSLDLFNCRSEDEFYRLYANSILNGTASKMDEALNWTKKFLRTFIPKLSASPDPSLEYSLSLDWRELARNPDEIIDLPERIAAEKGFRVIVCIDEFQQINTFSNPKAVQQKLRSHWQKHQHVAYCLYGSKRSMMITLFSSAKMPFYKFADIILLEKIDQKDWIKFFVKRFKETGKQLSEPTAAFIAQKVENHPYYAQQLAQMAWLRTAKLCSREIVEAAFNSLLDQLDLLFQTLTEGLSNSQVTLLRAIVKEETQLTAQKTIARYRLGSSSTVIKARNTLLDKEILDMKGKQLSLLDPLYAAWLKTVYFTNGFED